MATGHAYDLFMGRYSQPLAEAFADAVGVRPGRRALDVGCGPGALTGVLVERLGVHRVAAVDPSAPFVAECSRRHPGTPVRQGSAEAIPFGDGGFDYVLAQLVLHFVTDPEQCAGEFRRVLRPGGAVAACVWDFAEGMQMLRAFWDAATEVDADAPDEAQVLRFGRAGEIPELFAAGGFDDIVETTLDVDSCYSGFEELWAGFLTGIGPAGSYCLSLDEDRREALRQALHRRLGSPSGAFTLAARARCAVGHLPG